MGPGFEGAGGGGHDPGFEFGTIPLTIGPELMTQVTQFEVQDLKMQGGGGSPWLCGGEEGWPPYPPGYTLYKP